MESRCRLLFCLPKLTAYYEALGWQEVESSVLIEQPSGKIVSPLRVMVCRLGKKVGLLEVVSSGGCRGEERVEWLRARAA